MNHLFLFDVDSVLVEAVGYLTALQDAIAHFSRRMGLGDHHPTERDVRTFEALGLGCEWDTSSICVAALLVERVRREPAMPLPAEWEQALAYLAERPCPLPPLDYVELAERIVARLDGQKAVAAAARAVLWDEVRSLPDLGPATAKAVDALLKTLLGDTYDFYHTPVTRYFQHLVLGSQTISEVYGVTPEIESVSYLARDDEPLLAPDARERLAAAVSARRVRVAIYTARPSLLPAEVDGSALGYSPEGEIARTLVGLDGHPLIGKGQMQWLALQAGVPVEQLVKPSPVQGLAAIGAARSRSEAPALRAALSLYRDAVLRPPLADAGPLAVHTFEDTTGGLEAVQRAVELLQTAGVTANFYPYGVVPPGGAKAAAMARGGFPAFGSVNDALDAALELVGVPLSGLH